MKIKRNIITLLAVLAILGTLLGVAAVPASAQCEVSFITNTDCTVVGASVTITATWVANTIITAELDGVALTTSPPVVNTGETGIVTFAAKIPATTAGFHELTVTDGVCAVTFEDMYPEDQFQISPKLVVTEPTAKKGIVGSSVTIAGTGFTAGVSADVYFNDYIPVALDVPVASNGSFTTVGTVPNVDAGTYDVWAEDGAGHFSWAAEGECGIGDSFTVLPTLTVTPPSGLAGTNVRLYGTGWCADGLVDIAIAGNTYYFGVDVNSQSVLDTVIQIPADFTAGVKQIKVTCQGESAITQTVNFTVVGRALSLSPSSGPRGTMVLLTGSDMSAKPDNYIPEGWLEINGDSWNTGLPYPGGNYPEDIKISTGGVITPTSLPIPDFAALGNNYVQAWDNYAELEANAVFVVTQPTISLSPVSGVRGSTIVITGAGWVPGEEVTVEFQDNVGDVIDDVTPTAGTNGGFVAGLTVPNVEDQGAYQIVAYDDWENQAVAKTFTVPGPAITVSPTSGAPAISVTVSGTGFKKYIPVYLSIGDYDLPGQALPGVSGAFTYTFNAPGLAPGVQVVLAENNTQSANTFFTLSAAPVTVEDQLASCSSVIVRVWGFSGGTWYMYDPADPTGSDLDTLTPGQGYWIEASAACTVVYQAYGYPLVAGWNLIGWR